MMVQGRATGSLGKCVHLSPYSSHSSKSFAFSKLSTGGLPGIGKHWGKSQVHL